MEVKEDSLLVNKFEQDIKELEVSVKNHSLYNFKTINKRNFKIVGSIANFLIPVYVATAISIGGIKLLGGGLPFYTDSISVDANVKKYMDSNGTYTVSTSFEDFDEENYFKVSEGWHENEDGLFEKSEKTYHFTDANEDVIKQIVSGKKDDYESEFTHVDKKIEVKKELPSDVKLSDDKTFIEACIYSVDENNSTMQDEGFWRNFWFTVLDIVAAAGLGTLGCCIRKYKIGYKINNLKRKYKPISKEDIELTKAKILIKKKNIEALTKK